MKGCRVAVALGLAVLAAEAAHAACPNVEGGRRDGRFAVTRAEVVDRKTGLVWQRCSQGAVWSERGGCTGERTAYTYSEAVAAAGAATTGWRLPDAAELATLVERACENPAIDRHVFPDVSASDAEGAERYWTSTPGGLDRMMTTIDFADGYRDIHSPGLHLFVRLVRKPNSATR